MSFDGYSAEVHTLKAPSYWRKLEIGHRKMSPLMAQSTVSKNDIVWLYNQSGTTRTTHLLLWWLASLEGIPHLP